MRKLLSARLRDERGIALVMAIGITTVLLISGTTALTYTTSSQTESNQSRSRVGAFALAESGINNAMAILNLPANNALDPDVLPKCTTNSTKYSDPTAIRTSTSTWLHGTYAGSNVDYCGTLIRASALWYLTSIGNTRNPNKASGTVTRTLEATVTVTPTITQPLNNPVWNYLYAGHTGSTCDQELKNNINGASRMYIAGNLCLDPNVQLNQSTVIVGGDVNVANNAAIGASTNMGTRVETYVGGNCLYSVGSWAACSGNQDARHIYSKLSDGSTIGVNHVAPVVAPPAADYATWYENAIPGPSQSCTTSDGSDLRRQLPDPRQQRRHRLRPDAVELVLLPRRHRRAHDAHERADRQRDDRERRLRNRFPFDPVQHTDRQRVHDGDGRFRHYDLDGRARRQRLGCRQPRHEPDRRVGHGAER